MISAANSGNDIPWLQGVNLDGGEVFTSKDKARIAGAGTENSRDGDQDIHIPVDREASGGQAGKK